jgi:hypothetical protein
MYNVETDEAGVLLEDCAAWLKEEAGSPVLKQLNFGWVEITTPCLDRHNDYLQIYVRREGDHLLLTDAGHIIDDLIVSGSAFDYSRRKAFLNMVAGNFGVQVDGDAQLVVKAGQEDFPLKKDNLLRAMSALDSMAYLFC